MKAVMLKNHEAVHFISMDQGKTWERIPPERMEGSTVDVGFIREKVLEVHQKLGCFDCSESDCELVTEIMVQEIVYSRN